METPRGLDYLEGAIVSCEEKEPCYGCQRCLLLDIDSQPWNHDLERRTQQYGAKYDYKAKKLVAAPPFPASVERLAEILEPLFEEHSSKKPTQCIVNEYKRGQKITPHTDHVKLFGPVVVIVSLGDPMKMVLTRPGYTSYSITLEPGTALVLSGESRYNWKHELKPSKDPDFRRVSMTFRTH